jgi:hypothetical protein
MGIHVRQALRPGDGRVEMAVRPPRFAGAQPHQPGNHPTSAMMSRAMMISHGIDPSGRSA